MTEKGKRAVYTLGFKLEAVRLVQGGQTKAVTARILGVRDTNESVFAAFFSVVEPLRIAPRNCTAD